MANSCLQRLARGKDQPEESDQQHERRGHVQTADPMVLAHFIALLPKIRAQCRKA